MVCVGMLVSQLRGRVCCCASTGPGRHTSSVKIYDLDAFMYSLAALHLGRGEAEHDQV